MDFKDLILTFSSNPIMIANELIKVMAMINITVPMDPYNTLYLPKLFTKIAKSMEDNMQRNVVAMVPGE